MKESGWTLYCTEHGLCCDIIEEQQIYKTRTLAREAQHNNKFSSLLKVVKIVTRIYGD